MNDSQIEMHLHGSIEDLLNRQVLTLLRFEDFASRIVKLGVPEYRDCSIEEIKSLLPVEDGRVVTLSSDFFSIGCDIVFKARLPSGSRSMIINIEAQNAKPRSRRTGHRMVYYAAVLLSDQYGRFYHNQQYENLVKVTSVWVCPQAPRDDIVHVTMHSDNPASFPAAGFDLLSITALHMKKGGSSSTFNCDRIQGDDEMLLARDFVWDILSINKTREEKIAVLNKTLGIVDESLKKEVSIMCDYAAMAVDWGREQGIELGREQGIRQGREQGIRQGREQGIRQGREQGIELGREQGIEQGVKLGNILTYVSLYSKGQLSLDCVLQNTGLSEDAFLTAVELWCNGKLDVDTLKTL